MKENLGMVRIAPRVLATIARLTALSVPGVSRLCPAPMRVGSLWSGHGPNAGVRVDLVDDAVVIDIYVMAEPDANMLTLGREIQARVTRAVHDMVSMPVQAVNVFIRDIERSNTEP
ncbi:MAG TPA: Asp23/Gls24 family envelope stress response protein [Anaerolineae bacterium]|nr:Asp23/Gls24 family envelope stress response protein [Anaerolineae bacterium]HOR01536.1 Asp23/Gls24 family envelope stress response protein [Anaerolineae bacterium]HPL28640.1 Asp23/Gls24 family envelope stress response protein [Anaerolineae bacterium]